MKFNLKTNRICAPDNLLRRRVPKINRGKNRERGFTLLEMVIAMMLLLMVISLITALMVTIIKSAEKNEREGRIYSDLYFAEISIKNRLNRYEEYTSDGLVYDIAAVEPDNTDEGMYKIASEGNYLAIFPAATDVSVSFKPTAVMWFDKAQRSVIYSDKYDKLLLKTVDRITFFRGESAIKVSIYYNRNESPYILLIAFGRNQK